MKKATLYILLFASLAFTACSKFTRIQRNPDINARYEAAVQYYEEGDYYRAGLLFEELIPNFIGSAKSEELQFKFAYCQYNQSQFLLANHYFKSFYNTYQRSENAEEALYLSAYSLVLNTPAYNLDQSNTNEAITALQDFINRYPKSEYVEDASKNILELRKKLEVKAFDIAKRYNRLRRYKAAVIAFDNFQKDFPDSEKREEAAYWKMQSQFELARISIQSLKQERFSAVLEDYYYFIDRYKESKLIKDAESIFEDSQKQLKGL